MIYEPFNLVDRLHSDALEELYGPINTRMLHHDRHSRSVHLVDSSGISRTYALTLFSEEGVPEQLAEINTLIRTGLPIGNTFRQHGFNIRKNVLEVMITPLSASLKQAFCTTENHAKSRISEFLARRPGGGMMVYGIVFEIYHPEFRPAKIEDIDMLQVLPTVSNLIASGVGEEQIWNRLEKFQPRENNDPRYVKAMKASVDEIYRAKMMLIARLAQLEKVSGELKDQRSGYSKGELRDTLGEENNVVTGL